MKVTEEEKKSQTLQCEETLNNLSVHLSDCHVASSLSAFSLTDDASEFISVKEKKKALMLSRGSEKKQKQKRERKIRHLSRSDENVLMSDSLDS